LNKKQAVYSTNTQSEKVFRKPWISLLDIDQYIDNEKTGLCLTLPVNTQTGLPRTFLQVVQKAKNKIIGNVRRLKSEFLNIEGISENGVGTF
jgi:hypothetical protein